MANVLSIAYTTTPLSAGVKLVAFATRQVSAGINFMPNGAYKKLKVSAAAAASPIVLTTEYNALYGALITGMKIFYKLVPINAQGVAGVPILGSVIVV